MNIPDNLKYTDDHEWLKVEDNTAIIGITDYAQSELGDIVFVDVESDIDEIEHGESFGSIEAVKTVSDIVAPCTGKVLEVNPKLEDEPQLINEDPYGDGWIIKVELSDPSELDKLMGSETYNEHIGQE